MNKETKIATVLMVFTIIFTLIGSSFAYWVYRANITTVSFTVTKSFECSGDMGGVISTNELAPASCTHSRYAIQREVTVDPVIYAPGVSIYMDLWLNVDQVDAGLAASNNFKYALTRTANSCTDDVISTGTFRGKNRVNILEAEPFSYVNGMSSRPNLSTTYYLYVWLDAAESNIATQNNNFTLSLGGQCTQGEYVGGEYTPTGAEMLISKANGPTVTTYSEGDTGEMYTFSQPATVQVAATTDYRYIGSSPNNYITFNEETWRIIGVFDGKIKIIKDTSIGTMSWDYKKNGIGSSTSDNGSNDWVDSQLMYMLNPNDIATNVALKTGYTYDGTYVKDANNKIIYKKGCQPAETDGTAYTCTTNTWSLNSIALTQVADATYYLGGSSEYNMSAEDAYIKERSEAKYDDVRSTNWTGKVGLMYPSDVGYTGAYGADSDFYNNLGLGLYAVNWLIPDTMSRSMLTSGSDTSYKHFRISSYTAMLRYASVYDISSIYPVVYLREDVKLLGDGTVNNKYFIIEEPESPAQDITTPGSVMLVNKANDASITTYTEGDPGEMYTFSQSETTQLAATTDYRYIGSDPDNYILFNNEIWRIIGVFDGRIKIIRNDPVGNMSWDYKQNGVGSSTSGNGSDDWVDSQLMYMLNPGDIAANVALKAGYTHDDTYVYDANGKIIYQKGCLPGYADGTSYTCTQNTWNLNSISLSQVDDVTYYLGMIDFATATSSDLSAPEIYALERGDGKSAVSRSLNWTGKVGLMYPSDYVYTFSYGVDNTCYSDSVNCKSSSGGKPTSSWLYRTKDQYSITPSVIAVTSTGYIALYHPFSYADPVEKRPVVYLKPSIKLSGNGTTDANIYRIVS